MAQAKMPGHSSFSFFCEARVPFCGRNRHGEGDQVEPSSDCLIDAAIERLARADRQHASQTGDWDRDPWLLNTPTGTI